MEKGSARLFQQATSNAFEQSWNIVELETRKEVRQKIHTLLRLVNDQTVTSSAMRQELLHCVADFGDEFTTQLVRSLQRDSSEERQSLVWLLTLLNARETIPQLQQMSNDVHLPRAIRLSASLALAGMGVTAETVQKNRRVRLYALS
jgi:uncharacterized protein (UPF0147 family)